MGVLDLLCVTIDPGSTTFFGFAYAEDYNMTVFKPQYAALVKSNTKPSSPGDLTWSVVSMFDGSKLNGYPGLANGVDTSCTMNALGVFTMFGRYTSTASFAGTKVPFGIRYDPAGIMDPRVGHNGRGTWANIAVKDGFSWSGPFSRYALGYANSGAAAMLVHASISDTNNTITLATLNESTMTLVLTAVWNTNSTLHGKSIQALAIGNGNLYTFGLGASNRIAPLLPGFSLATIEGSYPSTLYTIKDPSSPLILTSEVRFNADVINMDYFVPIGPGSGASTFALIRRDKGMYAFGNDNGFRFTHLIKAVNVTDPVCSNPNPPPLPPPLPQPTPKSSSSSALTTGDISDIVVRAIVVIAGVLVLPVKRYQNRRSKDNITTTTADENQSVPGEDDDISVSSEKMEDESGPNYPYIEGKYSESSYAEGQAGSADILPMAPMTPIPEHMQEELKVLQEKMRVVQEQIRATQFSRHPRPNVVVTTVSNTAVSTVSGVPESEPGSGVIATPRTLTGWSESIPYVPPSCLPESMDLDYPSAPAYFSVIARASTQNSPGVLPHEFVESSEAVVSPPVRSSAVASRL